MLRRNNLHEKFHAEKRKLRTLVLQQDRGDSNLGSRQGSHASSFGLLQQLTDSLSHIDNIITIEDEITSLLDVFSLYLTNEETQNLFDAYQSLRSDMEQEVEILNSIKVTALSSEQIDTLDGAISEIKENRLELFFHHLVSLHLKLRNKVPETAYPYEFNEDPPQGESTNIKAALRFFRALNTASSEDSSKANPAALKGKAISIEEIIANFATLVWYPRISDQKLYNPGDSTDVESFKELGYKNSVRPRDNKIDTLCLILERHIGLMFTAFKFAVNEDNQAEIVNNFLFYFLSEKSSYEYSWKLPESIFNNAMSTIKKNILNLYGIGEESAKTSEGNKSSRSKSSSGSDEKAMDISPINLESDGSHPSDVSFEAPQNNNDACLDEENFPGLLMQLRQTTKPRKKLIDDEVLEGRRVSYVGEELLFIPKAMAGRHVKK